MLHFYLDNLGGNGWVRSRRVFAETLLAPLRIGYQLGAVSRLNAAPVFARKDLCKLGAKKENRRRVINPDKNQNQRAGGAKPGSDAARPEIKADEEFSDGEEDRGKDRADPDITPSNFHIRKNFVDEGEQDCQQRECALTRPAARRMSATRCNLSDTC